MRDIAEFALQAALDAGAAYADVRVQEVDTEEVSVRNGVLETAEAATSAGVGVRVLVDGAWGFAATSQLEGDDPAVAARLAVDVGRASAKVKRRDVVPPACAGFELVRDLAPVQSAPRVAEEALAPLTAPAGPSGTTSVVLDGSQVALQIHESVGHPTELDRILGTEAAYAGTSFLNPSDHGRLRYGSQHVTIVSDGTSPGGLGTVGWDDEGVRPSPTYLVRDGLLVGFQTSRETAAAIGQDRSNGTMRADGWINYPLIRMTNVSLLPGDSSLEELIASTDDGIYMTTNRSWSIDDMRKNFQFGCEIAWEIKGGQLGRMLKNPMYQGITTEFWGSCDGIAGPAEWKVWGVPNCGKGQPMQTARVGHGAAPARFRNVAVRAAE